MIAKDGKILTDNPSIRKIERKNTIEHPTTNKFMDNHLIYRQPISISEVYTVEFERHKDIISISLLDLLGFFQKFVGKLLRANPTYTRVLGEVKLTHELNGKEILSKSRMNKLSNRIKLRMKDESIRFIEERIPRKDGTKMRICIFKPLIPKENVPGVLWLHGGGYALGLPEQGAMMAKRFIEVSNCIVIAPEYRLSIEAPYPAALEDCYETLLWMKSHAEELGIRDNQLMVGGDSAGGGLTVALTLYARDKGEVAIAFQMPLYPMLDDRMTSESAKDNNAPVWNSKFAAYSGRLQDI